MAPENEKIKPNSHHQQPSSTQKPARFMTSSPLIPFKTIPNHSLEVSRAVVMIEKQSFGCYASSIE
jgi:hypothetical protein